jgi:hypothetical protein
MSEGANSIICAMNHCMRGNAMQCQAGIHTEHKHEAEAAARLHDAAS